MTEEARGQLKAQRWIESSVSNQGDVVDTPTSNRLAGIHFLIVCPLVDRNLLEARTLQRLLEERGARGFVVEPKEILPGQHPLAFLHQSLKMSHIVFICISVKGSEGQTGDRYRFFAESAIEYMMDQRLEGRILPVKLLPHHESDEQVADFWLAAIEPVEWSSQREAVIPRLEKAMLYWRDRWERMD